MYLAQKLLDEQMNFHIQFAESACMKPDDQS